MLENSIPRREDPTETTEQTSTTHETEKNTPETRTDTNTEHVDPSTEETSTVEAHNETPLTSILQNQIDMQEKINNLTTKRSMDPTMAAIIQSITLMATSSSAAQLESAKLQRVMAEAFKTAELRDKLKSQKKEEAQKESGWDKLDDTLKTTILTASTDAVSIPEKLTTSFIEMVQAKTGTVIRLRLKQKFHSGMMDADVVLCTVLSRGLLLSMPSPRSINNLSPFFTPADGIESCLTEDLLKIDIQYNVGNRLDDKDVRKLTKQTKTIPTNAMDLVQQIQNFSNLIREIFGENSYDHLQNLELFEEIRKQRRLLSNLYASLGEAFGFTVLHHIHMGNQLYLQSCSHGDITIVDLDALRFSSLMREIMMGAFQTSHLFQNHKRGRDDPEKETQPLR